MPQLSYLFCRRPLEDILAKIQQEMGVPYVVTGERYEPSEHPSYEETPPGVETLRDYLSEVHGRPYMAVALTSGGFSFRPCDPQSDLPGSDRRTEQHF